MTMLTPLGTGGQSRRPRRWPRALAAVVALAAVAAGAYGAWVWLDHRSDSDGGGIDTHDDLSHADGGVPRCLTAPAGDQGRRSPTAPIAPDSPWTLPTCWRQRGFTGRGHRQHRPTGQAPAWRRCATQPGDLASAITIARSCPAHSWSRSEDRRAAVPLLWLGPDFPEQGGITSTTPTTRQQCSCRQGTGLPQAKVRDRAPRPTDGYAVRLTIR